MTINYSGKIRASLCTAVLLTLVFSMGTSANAGIVGPNESVTRAATAASTNDPTGPTVDGLAVALSSTTPIVKQGSPIRISVEVRNVSSTTQYVLIPLSPCGYRISLTNVATGAKSDISPHGCPVYSAGDLRWQNGSG
jgi:hypothetical protein